LVFSYCFGHAQTNLSQNSNEIKLQEITNFFLGEESDKDAVSFDSAGIDIPVGFRKNLHWDLPLDSIGKHGSKIQWRSSNKKYISDQGKLLGINVGSIDNVKVILTAVISKGRFITKKSFEVQIASPEPRYDGYLFAYFSGNSTGQEQLRFGVSADAINWYTLNNNKPVISSSLISKSGGIRDPHILRGEDGKTFYVVATDMQVAKYGWGSNPGIVLLKSTDLVNWTHAYVDFKATYPKNFGNAKWLWAPQTIYDPETDKYMIYFTVAKFGAKSLDFYCGYANADFSGFESEPTLMFSAKYGAIDGDILYKNGLYHLFYKGNTKDANGNEIKNGIQQAVSKSLHGPWTEDFIYLDAYAGTGIPVEGSGIFKLNNSDNYVLMYDIYTKGRYEYQLSSDLFIFSSEPKAFVKNFNPRHGTVTGITMNEVLALNDKWSGMPDELTALNTIRVKNNFKNQKVISHSGFYVESNHASKIKIYLSEGKLLKCIKITEGKNYINLPNGIYFISTI
jgi:hypothetical protein